MDGFDGTVTAGRKGLAYDWRSVLLAAEPQPTSTAESWVTDDALAAVTAQAPAR